jgi:hypothetical protein
MPIAMIPFSDTALATLPRLLALKNRFRPFLTHITEAIANMTINPKKLLNDFSISNTRRFFKATLSRITFGKVGSSQ